MELTSLKRTRIGGLRLDLKLGGYVELKPQQITQVLQEPGV
jgi:16S rRNA U516 pseudouridylate synthase RsuA-like enzyme